MEVYAEQSAKLKKAIADRKRYYCIVVYLVYIKKFMNIIVDKIKKASYLNTEVETNLNSTVTHLATRETIPNPFSTGNLTGILLNLDIKYLKATVHDFLNDVGAVYNKRCTDISETVTFIENLLWECHGKRMVI